MQGWGACALRHKCPTPLAAIPPPSRASGHHDPVGVEYFNRQHPMIPCFGRHFLTTWYSDMICCWEKNKWSMRCYAMQNQLLYVLLVQAWKGTERQEKRRKGEDGGAVFNDLGGGCSKQYLEGGGGGHCG